ncbi:MAG: hypothetical protein V1834_03640, partial [Candidatus Micrarchaeota archaeon]
MAEGGLYKTIEDKYYAFLDWVNNTLHIPVYDFFVNPIEDRGYPSFPFFVLIILVLLSGIAFLALGGFPQGQATSLTVTVMGPNGAALENAKVMLQVGDESYVQYTSAGVAKFSNLPAGQQATLQVTQQGFKAYSQEITLGDEPYAQVYLSADSTGLTSAVKLLVTDEDGVPVVGATVSYKDPSSGQLKREYTRVEGSVELAYSTTSDSFDLAISKAGFEPASATCFASSTACYATMTKSIDDPTNPVNLKATVVVYVKNGVDEKIPSHVKLYQVGVTPPIAAGDLGSGGSIMFTEVADANSQVYVAVWPESDDYPVYNGKLENNLKTTSSSSNTVFTIVLEEMTAAEKAEPKTIEITVLNEIKNPFKNVEVSLYLTSSPESQADAKKTDSAGLASFEVAANGNYYATVYSAGYLPAVATDLKVGDVKQIELVKAIPGNNGQARVTVLDSEGVIVPQARVDLFTSNGFNSGIPRGVTLADGSVTFSGLPLSETYFARANKGGLTGKSDGFQITLGEEKLVEVRLNPPTGTVAVEVIDATTNEPVSNASVSALLYAQAVSSCVSDAQGKCVLLGVESGKPVKLLAQADGFVDYRSEELTLEFNKQTDYKFKMIPSYLSDELAIIDFKVVPALDAVDGVDALERGSVYKAVLVGNFPEGLDNYGFFMRLGDASTISEEKAFFKVPSASPGEGITSHWSPSFNPGGSCDTDLASQQGTEAKWVEVEKADGYSGVDALVLDLRVRSTASSADTINVYYRIFADKAGIWARAPDDPLLGNQESVSEKDSCYATTNSKAFSVLEGKGKCNADACLALEFISQDGLAQPSQIDVSVGDVFQIHAQARVFKQTSDVQFKITSLEDDAVYFTGVKKSVTRQLDSDRFEEFLDVDAVLPVDAAQFRAELSDLNGALVSFDNLFARVNSGAKMNWYLDYSGDFEENQQYRVTAYVNAEGSNAPVTGASFRLTEADRHPFAGDPQASVIDNGDGSYDLRFTPVSGGTFEIEVRKGSDFVPNKQSFYVQDVDFLSIQPSGSLTVGCDWTKVKIVNDADLKLAVTAGFGIDTACIDFRASDLDFNVNGEAIFDMNPARPGKPTEKEFYVKTRTNFHDTTCLLQVVSEPAQVDPVTLTFMTNCPSANVVDDGGDNGTDTQVSPTPPAVGECSADNCEACTEVYCKALETEGYCTSVITRAPNATTGVIEDTFVRCEQSNATRDQDDTDPCDPENFNFEARLAAKLGQQIGSSLVPSDDLDTTPVARVQISVEPTGARIVNPGDCQMTGFNQLTCRRAINAIVPTNALAFTVRSAMGTSFELLHSKTAPGTNQEFAQGCFELSDPSQNEGLFDLRQGIDTVASMIIPKEHYVTRILRFRGDDPNCIDYKITNGKVSAKPIPSAAGVTFKFQPANIPNEAGAFYLTVYFDEDAQLKGTVGDLALFAVPSAASTVNLRGDTHKQKFLVFNNMQYEDVTVTPPGGTPVTINRVNPGVFSLASEATGQPVVSINSYAEVEVDYSENDALQVSFAGKQ